ncbi:hypothetical protein DFP73DRAFT_595612 [Morchella snyderi]|nr:hypothetical protein DFP73DRAFT_595612 [Morchella snyderi]
MATVTLNKGDIIAIAIGCTTICINALGVVEVWECYQRRQELDIENTEIAPEAVTDEAKVFSLPSAVSGNHGIDLDITTFENNNSSNTVDVSISSTMDYTSPPDSPSSI